MVNKVSKGAIKEAIKNIDKAERRLEMQNSKKVGNRLTDNEHDNTYLANMSLIRCRTWIRHRARMIKGVKYNMKRSYKDLKCRFCMNGDDETQEHLEVCGGCVFERRGLDMSVRSDIVKFWLRMEKKIVEKNLKEKKEVEKNKPNVATVT